MAEWPQTATFDCYTFGPTAGRDGAIFDELEAQGLELIRSRLGLSRAELLWYRDAAWLDPIEGVLPTGVAHVTLTYQPLSVGPLTAWDEGYEPKETDDDTP